MKTFKEYIAEGNPLARVKKHIDDNRHFVGISAERGNYSKAENKKRMKELMKRVRAAGYGYKKAEGQWEGGKETSIIVHAKGTGAKHGNQLKQDMKRLARDNEQDAVLYHDGKEGKLIGTNETGFPGKGKVASVGKVRYNKDVAPYQTELKPGKKNSARFTTGD